MTPQNRVAVIGGTYSDVGTS